MNNIKRFNNYKKYSLFENSNFWGNEGSGILPICIKTGRILIGLRNYWVNEPHTWGIFGGAIGLSHSGNKETPRKNALKELEEELGYKGPIKLEKSFIFKKQNFKYTNYIGLVDYEFVPDLDYDGLVEIKDAKWVTLEELLNQSDKHFGLQALIDNALDQIKTHTIKI